MDTDEKRSAALSFLKANTVGALATSAPENTPRVRLVHYASDGFIFYFLTLENTRKSQDLRANAKAAFVVASNDTCHTLQIEGQAIEITDTATLSPELSALTKQLFPKDADAAPVTHLDPSKPVMFMLSPTWIRWGDFTNGDGNAETYFEISA